MKNLNIYMLLMTVLVFVACDPMKETIDKLDENPPPITADLDFTLTDDDYELSGIPSAEKFHSFSNIDDAKEGIPNILDAKYPQLGKPSSAKVGYDLYQGSVRYIYDDYEADYAGGVVENPIPVYTLQSEDYDEVLGTPNYGNFDNPEDIVIFLNYKYPDASTNDGVLLTYQYYSGGTSTVTATWSKAYDFWYEQRVLSKADGDYEYMQRGSRDYFSSNDDAEEKIPVWLNPQFPYAKAGDRYMVQYLFRDYNDEDDDGKAKEKERIVLNEFNGSVWELVSSIAVSTLKLGHDGNSWVPDNTIKYTMSGADYDFVIIEYESVNAAGVASMATYGNYDLTIWSDDEVTSSLGAVLNENFSSAEEGQKYAISYEVWTGSAGLDLTKLFVMSGGSYVPLNE